jgi:glycosyltransferase involved in cell wall biosynthesis
MLNNEIIIFTDSLSRGGTERHLAMVAPKLANQGFLLSIFLLKGGGPLAQDITDGGVQVWYPWRELPQGASLFTKLIWLVSIAAQIFLLLLKRRPRLVHCFLPTGTIVVGSLAWMLGIKSRIMSRRSLNNYAKKLPKFIRNYEVFIQKQFHLAVGNSQVVCDQLIEEGIAKERVLLIYNGFEPKKKKFRCIKKRRSTVVKSPYAFISVANLIPYKGHRDLLEAIRLLPAELDFTVTLVGEGNKAYQEELQATVSKYKLNHKVIFAGATDEIESYIWGCDAGIIASHEEGFSNFIIECMSMKKPIIVSDAGGNVEAITHCETGLVFPSGDATALSENMLRILVNRELATVLGENAKARFDKHFTLDNCVREYRNLYETALKSRN